MTCELGFYRGKMRDFSDVLFLFVLLVASVEVRDLHFRLELEILIFCHEL